MSRIAIIATVILLSGASVIVAINRPHKSTKLSYTSNTVTPWTTTDESVLANCSTWYNCGEINWMCDLIPLDKLKCSNNHTLSILTCHCVTYNDNEDTIELGKCMYNTVFTPKNLIPYKDLPHTEDKINDIMCKQFNRNGTLCSRCQDGYYPLAYSFDMDCVECPDGKYNWWKFVLVAFLPLTIFYFVILLFQVGVISSHLHGFFYFSQAVSLPMPARAILIAESVRRQPKINVPLRLVAALYGVWNLDFFRSLNLHICVQAHMLTILALDLAVGLYPILLMVLTYFLIHLYDRNFRLLVVIWRPFRAVFGLFKRNWEVRTSLIDAFATFFLLLNSKFLSVAFDLLTPVQVYQVNSVHNYTLSWRLYYNASVPYFGETHLPYAILGMAVLLFLVVLPTLILILYPFSCFQKFLNLFPFRWYILHTFMDSFLGCFKDGTHPGTCDCRWFASTFFILRLIVSLIGVTTFDLMYYPMASIVLVSYSIVLINLNPFKETKGTFINSAFLLLLALTYVSMTGFSKGNQENQFPLICAISLAMFLPLIYIIALSLHWTYRHRKFGLELFRKLKAWRRGYEALE